MESVLILLSVFERLTIGISSQMDGEPLWSGFTEDLELRLSWHASGCRDMMGTHSRNAAE